MEKLARAGLTVLRPDPDAPAGSFPLFLSRIPAGFPSPADDYLETRLDLNRHCIPHPEATFFLRVSGSSMMDLGILDGDLAIVDRSLKPKSGDVVIAALDGELTVKRLTRQGGGIVLAPGNPEYAPIPVGPDQDLVIWGVVTFVLHRLRGNP